MRGAALRIAGVCAVAAAALPACRSADGAAVRERRANDAFVAANAALLDGKHGAEAVIVQRGTLAAAAKTTDEAARLADEKDPDAAHRFVFRPPQRGDRLFRTAWLAEGGVAAGPGFFEALGFRVRPSSPGTLSLDGPGGRKTIDLVREGALRIVLRSFDGKRSLEIAAAVDADFDGGLLIAPAHGAVLGVVRSEIPGRADVQVALGRPFSARRTLLRASVPSLGAEGVVEVLVPDVSR